MLSLTDIDQKTVVIRQVVFLLFFLSFRQQFEYFFLAKRVKCSAGGERQEKAFKLNSFCSLFSYISCTYGLFLGNSAL